MDRKVEIYDKILSEWLADYVQNWTSDQIEYQFIHDSAHYHYQVVKIGWDGSVFRHIVIFHFQIKETGKIWIYVNRTDIEIGEELTLLGIPKSDIVIGFQPASIRSYTGYAVA